jgi:hypothetical protein
MTRENVESELAAAIDADTASGSPYWGPGSEMASIAFRRWSTFARRHKTKQPTFDHRVHDLAKGLRLHYQPDIQYAPESVYLELARVLAEILAREDDSH